ncbi:MAG: 4Fe-4S binding protein [Euryarchaeota archaeon]|nr:4Fe-4S binding protein [Euryarchaeota archaeon]
MFKFFDLGVRKHGVVTTRYPSEAFVPPEGSLGMPDVDGERCNMCGRCSDACPTGAISLAGRKVTVDLGLCIFCGECARSCADGGMFMSREFELATRSRGELEVEHDVKG